MGLYRSPIKNIAQAQYARSIRPCIALLVRRERIEGENKAHGHKTARSLKEQKEYLISGIPAWGPSDSQPAATLRLHRKCYDRLREGASKGLYWWNPGSQSAFREPVGGEHEGIFSEDSWRETDLFRLGKRATKLFLGQENLQNTRGWRAAPKLMMLILKKNQNATHARDYAYAAFIFRIRFRDSWMVFSTPCISFI